MPWNPMNKNFKVRRALIKDVSLIAKIKINSGYRIYELEPTSIEKQKEKIYKKIKQGNEYYIINLKGKPVAILSIKNPSKNFNIKKNFILFKDINPGGEFVDLYILKEHHNKGIGHFAVRFVLDLFKENGHSAVSCIAWEKNFNSIRMLYSAGFKFVGIDPKHFANGDSAKIFNINLNI
jgi:ribosomal protein S18 acetylase RimI-like enzyme